MQWRIQTLDIISIFVLQIKSNIEWEREKNNFSKKKLRIISNSSICLWHLDLCSPKQVNIFVAVFFQYFWTGSMLLLVFWVKMWKSFNSLTRKCEYPVVNSNIDVSVQSEQWRGDHDDRPEGIFAPRRTKLGSPRECKLGQMNIFNIGPTTTTHHHTSLHHHIVWNKWISKLCQNK